MPRELRVRSPLINRQGPPALTITAGMKRKLNGNEFSLRRSTRGVESLDPPLQLEEPIRARWDGKILTISGVPADALAEDSGVVDDEEADNSDNDSQDVATWEEKWMGSPTKRRRVDRSAQDSRPNYETRSHDQADAKPQRSRRLGYDDLEEEKPKPRAVERLSRATGRHSAEPSSRQSSRQSSPSSSRRRYALAPSKASATGDRAPLPNGHKTDDLEQSARSTPAQSLSPPLSTATTPERDEAGNGQSQANEKDQDEKDPDELDEHDLPGPHLDLDLSSLPEEFEDEADRLLRHLYPPIPQPQRFIQALTSHHPSKRSTETLKALAANAQFALRVWQDEYIRLDKKTAPVSLPFPKKPCTGGRIPANPDDYELEKYRELYSDGSKLAAAMGIVMPPTTRNRTVNGVTVDSASGRELRRRGADTRLVDGLGISSDDAGAKKPIRARKPVRRFDAGRNNNAADVAVTPVPVPAPFAPAVVPSKEVDVKRVRPTPTIEQQAPQKKRRRRRGPDNQLYWAEEMEDAKRRYAASLNGANGSVQPIASAAEMSTSIQTHASGSQISNAAERTHATDGTHATAVLTESGVPLATSAEAETPTREMSPGEAAAAAEKKARAKSLKRSESMTAWWAQRKKKLAEDQIKEQYSRGDFREGQWNVDSLKGWTQPDAASLAAGRLVPSPGSMDPQYAAWMAQYAHDPRATAHMQGIWQQQYAGAGVPYPYGAYGWPPGTPYDPRMYQQPSSAPHPHAHASQDPRHPGLTPLLPPPSQSSHLPPTTVAGTTQALTPNHPFAHPPQPSHQRPPPPPLPQNTPAKHLPPPMASAQSMSREPYAHHYQRSTERRPSAASSAPGPEPKYHHYNAHHLPPYPSEKRVGNHARTTSSSSSSWANAPPPPPPPTSFTAPPPPPKPLEAPPYHYHSSSRQAHEQDTSPAHYAHKRSGSQTSVQSQVQPRPYEHHQHERERRYSHDQQDTEHRIHHSPQQYHQQAPNEQSEQPPRGSPHQNSAPDVRKDSDQHIQQDLVQHAHDSSEPAAETQTQTQTQSQQEEPAVRQPPQPSRPQTPPQHERPSSQHDQPHHQHHGSDPANHKESLPAHLQQISPPRRGSLPHQPHALYQWSPTERAEPPSERKEASPVVRRTEDSASAPAAPPPPRSEVSSTVKSPPAQPVQRTAAANKGRPFEL